MSKYIRLDEATDLLRGIDATMTGEFVADLLENLPKIDIVLCGECESSDISEATGITRCCKFEFFNDIKGGCSYGERIEE